MIKNTMPSNSHHESQVLLICILKFYSIFLLAGYR
jgi:hypothetical protein